MTDLGPEWKPDRDGILSRNGARLLIFDEAGNLLLVRGHDTHDANHSWWFAVGGGLEPGEEAIEGAIREAKEETGLRFSRSSVFGPAVLRKAEFQFRNVLARQAEVFFVTYLSGVRPPLGRQHLTDLERETLDGFAWFSPEQVAKLASEDTVYPAQLPDLAARWAHGWDGVLVNLIPEGGWTLEQ